ncbi:MAG: XTP/dITP diphosphatase [Firmicutes bacterium]|nr:XTP/dITP diphosphatase [Bacillota bacterium]
MRKLVLATTNKGKIAELQELLAGVPVAPTGLDSYPEAPMVCETGQTFAENAILKAETIMRFVNELVLADDSGLEVDCLNGEPGIFSARYGQPGWSDRERFEFLLKKLAGFPPNQWTARFRCVVALANPETQTTITAEGVAPGIITATPRGTQGFGYDPIFYLPEYQCTMAELSPELKNQISHRGRAVRAIIPHLARLAGRFESHASR